MGASPKSSSVSGGQSLVSKPSKRKERNRVYSFIGDVSQPGDILFVSTPAAVPQTGFQKFKWHINFTSQGYPTGDYREWGTMVFSHMKKESNGGNWIPMVYQSKEPKLKLFRLPPGYFRGSSRLEVVRSQAMNEAASKKVLAYLNDRLDEPHDHSELIWNRITMQTGLPNFFIRRKLVNCVRTTMEAYAAAGLLFAHRCEYAAIWNYARYLGYPLLHSAKGVSPKFNYLQDHHLYSDPQMDLTGSVFQHGENIITSQSSEKFSWVGKEQSAVIAPPCSVVEPV